MNICLLFYAYDIKETKGFWHLNGKTSILDMVIIIHILNFMWASLPHQFQYSTFGSFNFENFGNYFWECALSMFRTLANYLAWNDTPVYSVCQEGTDVTSAWIMYIRSHYVSKNSESPSCSSAEELGVVNYLRWNSYICLSPVYLYKTYWLHKLVSETINRDLLRAIFTVTIKVEDTPAVVSVSWEPSMEHSGLNAPPACSINIHLQYVPQPFFMNKYKRQGRIVLVYCRSFDAFETKLQKLSNSRLL